MARQGRQKSETGIYHILLRGIDRRDIFLEDEDKNKFIEYIEKAKEKGNFFLYGYCLMDNHVHMLVKEKEEIGKSVKRIAVGYVGWHNTKYERVGHLFQNRFKSEPVETESYFVTALRYIHQNPVKAGMVKKAEEYRWSSYKQYIYAYQGYYSRLVDTQLVEAYFPTAKEFEEFMDTDNNDELLEYEPIKKHNSDTFKIIIQKKYGIADLNSIPIQERRKIINNIYNEMDISIRQLSKALGVGKTVVEKALREDK